MPEHPESVDCRNHVALPSLAERDSATLKYCESESVYPKLIGTLIVR